MAKGNRGGKRASGDKGSTRDIPIKTMNKNGEEIQFEWMGKDEQRMQQQQLISKLSNEYNTRLQTVTLGAKKAAGTVDISGSTMKLSSSDDVVVFHEFAHTLANSMADKYGLTDDGDFWKEIKKIKRDYHKDVDRTQNTSRWISFYEHSNGTVDEFFAEAFTHAKMQEMGLKTSGNYGADFTYSKKVLDVVDKYFKKRR